jgi:hypothetical protein
VGEHLRKVVACIVLEELALYCKVNLFNRISKVLVCNLKIAILNLVVRDVIVADASRFVINAPILLFILSFEPVAGLG